MSEDSSRFHHETQIMYNNSETKSHTNWMLLPPVAMELVLKKSTRNYERRSLSKKERVKDNDIVIPDELLEELSNVPPTPVSFNINQVGAHILFTYFHGDFGFGSQQ